MTTKRMPRALAVWRLYSSKNCLTSWRSWFISPGDARKTWYSATLRGFKAIVIPLGFVPTRCRHGILPYEVVEEFGCSAWSAVCLGVQSEMNTSTETHLAPWFHGNLSAESISRVLSKSAVDYVWATG